MSETIQDVNSTADFTKRIASLTPEKRALLALMLKKQGRQFNSFPLSFAQQRLWFMDQLEPNLSVYNIPVAVRLRGRLDTDALAQSLSEIVRRHEVLRTTYASVNGEPVQVINPAQAVPLSIVDLSELPPPEREDALDREASEEAQRPFDLTRGPLLRAGLLRLAQEDHVVLLTMHHIASDGWSMDVLVREVSALYEAFSTNRPSPLPELGIQYADYANWQREYLQGDALERELNYWRENLAGAPAMLELPTDKARPAVQSFRGAQEPFTVSSEVAEGLRELSRSEGVTLFMTLLAAFQTLLHRYSGQDDIVVGIPTAGRNRLETENLIGFFVNTLAIRARMDSNPGFDELLGSVREATLGAYAHQDLPFEKLVEELQPDRSLSHTPLFQVMFALQQNDSQPPPPPSPSGLQMQPFSSGGESTKFDLTLAMLDTGHSLGGAIGYNTDLFDAATIERMSGHFQTLLQSIVTDAATKVSELEMLTATERHRQLVEWSATEVDFGIAAQQCVHELFEGQAERTPEAVAVSFEGASVSYRELNERANQLAHHLRGAGASGGELVGVLLERGVELVVGMLGVLKAGCGYVPLEGRNPGERLRMMVEDAGVRMVVTQNSLRQLLSSSAAQLISIDEEAEEIARCSTENVDSGVTTESLAYVIYTSGSTGQPKGTEVLHGSLTNVLLAGRQRFNFNSDDVMPCLASSAFDIFFFELLNPLLAGGTAIVLDREQILDADRLDEVLKQATRLHAVPQLMRQISDYAEAKYKNSEGYPQLRTIFTGGDAVPPELLNDLQRVFPSAEIHVLYGPTEATIICSCYSVPKGQRVEKQVIGRALANMTLRLLDRHLAPVPVGLSAELFIAGAGLARGYLDRPSLTAERFLFIDGQRFYRTGDLARYLPDGSIEFLGRSDHQVKVRGFRIELGEVEAALRSHPDVQEAIVVARADGADKRLVAYLVPHLDADATDAGDSRSVDAANAAQATDLQLWPSIGEYPVYDELIYHGLTSDEPRNLLYQEAINSLVKDKVVLDIGTGGDAILARFCAEAGARTVYAVEILEASYLLAKRRIEELGLSHRIKLIHGDAARVELPELCDVCVTETFEAIGGAEGAAVIINGARRLLKPEAVVIPQCSITRIAAVRLPEELRGERAAFTEVSAHYVEKIFAAVGHRFDLRLCIKNFPATHIISQTDVFEELDFSGRAEADYHRTVRMEITERSRFDGFLLWLRLDLAPTTHLDIMEGSYSWFPTFIPAFAPGVEVEAGDVVEAECRSWVSDDGVHPDYEIEGRVLHADGRREAFSFRSAHHEARYKSHDYYAQLWRGEGVPVSAPQSAAVREAVSGAVGGLRLADIRQHVAERLPEYMVPQAMVTLEALPLTANGKVNRQALAQMDERADERAGGAEGRGARGGGAAAATAVEEILQEVWRRVLKVAEVGVEENFFELGGHSLLATQVISRVREAFGVEVALRVLFERPTVRGLGASIEAELRGGVEAVERIGRVSREGELPLSFAQQRLWFVDQLEPGTGAYNVPVAMRLRGVLDVSALERAMGEIVHRHEALRTVFITIDEQPAQIIMPAAEIRLAVTDLSDIDEDEKESETYRLAREEGQRPFDLARGPLLRAGLLHLAQEDHVVLLTMHHIASDGWSMGILVREVAALYEAFTSDRPSPLPELEIQYADYASWQREYLQGEVLERELSYWRQKLEGAPAVLELPTDKARPAVQSFRGAQEPFTVSNEVAEGLRELSRSEGVTLFMTLLAAFQTLLHRYSGQDDIVVGTPIAGRNRIETEPLIGFFVNTLILRTEISGEPSFRELLRRVREMTLGAYGHQDLPFEKLVEELQPDRSLSHTPLFQVMFALQQNDAQPPPPPSPSGLQMQPFSSGGESTKFDLTLAMLDTGHSLGGAIGYNTDLFDAATIERMSGHFQTLLQSIVADAATKVSELEMLTAAERQQQLVEWSGAEVDFGVAAQQCVHELFEGQAERTPEAVAVSFEGASVSYGELNERANQLAHHLRGAGASEGELVGVLLERGVDLVVGMLGVLKAGCGYVPLEGRNPGERLRMMVEDAGVRMVVTQNSLRQLLPVTIPHVLCVDDESETISQRPVTNLRQVVNPNDVAYVIYTSGSTGIPKGVVVEHRNLVNCLCASQAAFNFGGGDVMPCIASSAFDIFFFELLSPMLVGGTSLLLTVEQVLDTAYLAEILDSLTALHTLPSLMRHLVDFAKERSDGGGYRNIDKVFVGGDMVPLDLLEDMREVFPNARIYVLYGPTEGTIICSSYEVPHDRTLEHHVIGRALANMTLRLLDRHLAPVPVGLAAELFIAGAGLARGYLDRPSLTAERFIFIDGQRFYRTGDLARYLPDGSIEFLGRSDHQVKVRGFRIELGEVEAALRSHPDVQEAIVVARADGADKRLVAYLVPHSAADAVETQDAGSATHRSTADQSTGLQLWPSIGEYPVYDELIYHGLTSDEPRNLLYQAAITSLVKDKVVLDIGTGGDAILARFCAEAGARTVYAVEILEASYLLAKRRIEELGLSHRIKLIHGDAARVELPELCDVCVTETFEAIGGAEGAAVIINGARRLLKPEAVVIPQCSITRIAAVRLPEELRGERAAFTEVSAHYVEKIFAAVGHRFDLRLCIKNFPATHIISQTDVFEELDFSGRAEADYRRTVRMEITERSRFDGFLLWLRLDLAPTTHLDIMEGSYSWFPTFIPAFAPGVEVEAGDVVEAECRSWVSDDGVHPDYEIEGWVMHADGRREAFSFRSAHHEARYKSHDYYAQLWRGDNVPVSAAERVAVSGAGNGVVGGLRLADIRRHMAERLPEYMVPQAMVTLEALPLTANGKVNRQALAQMDERADERAGGAESRGARGGGGAATAVEEILQEVWRRVLKVAEVGVEENFFELGGHSLLATQVISRVREAFGVEVALRVLFERPTVRGLGASIEAELRGGVEAVERIGRVSREGELPLSFAQQRLWFIDQMQPNSSTYNIPMAVRLRGGLNVRALEQTISEILCRHEALRTRFELKDAEPFQVINPAEEVRLTVTDLSSLSAEAREAEARRLATVEAQLPFDLSRGPLLRAGLLRLAEDDHMVLLTMHHIASDGWSMSILVREVAALYEAFTSDRPSPLPELEIQYADYASWQREYLQGEVLERELSYWRNQLAGAPAVLELPTDRARPAAQSFRGANQSFRLSEELTRELKELSRSEGVTLFMTLLAAWQLLLHRYSGQEGIVVGMDSANRNRYETEGLIGFFVNLLVLHTNMSGNPSFQELLGRVREVALGAYAHQNLPFEKLVEELQPERNLSYAPLFQVMFALQQNESEQALSDLGGLQFQSLDVTTDRAKFDLTLTMLDDGQSFSGSIEYSTDLFEATTIKRMIEHFRNLVESVVRNPQQGISEVALLSESEQHQLLVAWNETSASFPSSSIQHLFEQQVVRSPSAVALSFEDNQLTYAQLNERANCLAHYLGQLGVGPETFVGLFLDHSIEMVVALLGILKAGGAYVPLDPEYPLERLALMIEECAMPVVLTEEHLEERLPVSWAQVITLDAQWDEISACSGENPEVRVEPENLAYVIYTSGSTGRPKGVMISHRSLSNYICWSREVYVGDEAVAFPLYSSLAFDLTVTSIYTPLLTGNRIVVYRGQAGRTALPTVLEDNQVEALKLTPSHLALLSERDNRGSRIRRLIVGGEALGTKLAQTVTESFGGKVEIMNEYGPTETTVGCMLHRFDPATDTRREVLIGRGGANVEVYVLDGRGQVVGIGVVGELYVGGAGVARGYWQRAEQTAERFVPDHLSGRSGGRLYRTGDLARYVGEGRLEFVGRADEQVKVRGYRIELGEIESVLREAGGVRESVVVVRGEGAEKRLVGYVVRAAATTEAEEDGGRGRAEMWERLRGRLPEYMIPDAIVELDALPMTANGKLDRRALPAPDMKNSERAKNFVAPRDTVELKLANIWSGILNVNPIGVHDNFFALGGHSLLAVRLIARIQDEFGQEIALSTIFQAATIENLAGLLRNGSGSQSASALVPIQTHGWKRPFVCVHPSGGQVLCYYHLARYMGEERPFYGLEAPGFIDVAENNDNYQTIEERAAAYLEALRELQPEGPYLLGGWSFGGVVAFEMAQQLRRAGQKVDMLALLDTIAPLVSTPPDESEDAVLLISLAMEVSLQANRPLELSAEAIQGLDLDVGINYVLNAFSDAGLLPPDIQIETAAHWLRQSLHGTKIRNRALTLYEPKIYEDDITIFTAEINSAYLEDPGLKEMAELYKDHVRGWGELSTKPVTVVPVPGHHATMLLEPNVRTLAELLNACIGASEEASQL